MSLHCKHIHNVIAAICLYVIISPACTDRVISRASTKIVIGFERRVVDDVVTAAGLQQQSLNTVYRDTIIGVCLTCICPVYRRRIVAPVRIESVRPPLTIVTASLLVNQQVIYL